MRSPPQEWVSSGHRRQAWTRWESRGEMKPVDWNEPNLKVWTLAALMYNQNMWNNQTECLPHPSNETRGMLEMWAHWKTGTGWISCSPKEQTEPGTIYNGQSDVKEHKLVATGCLKYWWKKSCDVKVHLALILYTEQWSINGDVIVRIYVKYVFLK